MLANIKSPHSAQSTERPTKETGNAKNTERTRNSSNGHVSRRRMYDGCVTSSCLRSGRGLHKSNGLHVSKRRHRFQGEVRWRFEIVQRYVLPLRGRRLPDAIRVQ